MPFHRLTVPSYSGGLPGGYDYINNALVGTPANADSAKVGGVNAGTYFTAFNEDSTSNNANRSHKALAENCDLLDDLLRRDLAIATRTTDVLAGAPVSSIILTGPGIFLGASGTPNTAAGINTFIEILDDNDNEIVDATGTRCAVPSLTGGTVGSGGFSAGNVTLTVSPAIPTGKTYRVYYGIQSNLATIPVDALTNIKIRSAQEISAQLEGPGGAALIGASIGSTWADATGISGTTVDAAIEEVITDLAATTGDVKVGSPARSASPTSLASGSVGSQLLGLLTALNAFQNTKGAASGLAPLDASTKVAITYLRNSIVDFDLNLVSNSDLPVFATTSLTFVDVSSPLAALSLPNVQAGDIVLAFAIFGLEYNGTSAALAQLCWEENAVTVTTGASETIVQNPEQIAGSFYQHTLMAKRIVGNPTGFKAKLRVRTANAADSAEIWSTPLIIAAIAIRP